LLGGRVKPGHDGGEGIDRTGAQGSLGATYLSTVMAGLDPATQPASPQTPALDTPYPPLRPGSSCKACRNKRHWRGSVSGAGSPHVSETEPRQRDRVFGVSRTTTYRLRHTPDAGSSTSDRCRSSTEPGTRQQRLSRPTRSCLASKSQLSTQGPERLPVHPISPHQPLVMISLRRRDGTEYAGRWKVGG
jgi:hypothetical protein